MLKRSIPSDLLGPNNEGALFFAQRVDELSYAYTRESYRASTTTVPFLVRECLAVIKDHNDFDLHISGVERVFDELKRRCHSNIVVNELVSVPLDLYFEWDKKDVAKLEGAMRVLSREITPLSYKAKARELISGTDPKEKERMNFLAGEYISCLINVGVSSEYINEKVCEIFFPEMPTAKSDRLSEFLDSMKLKPKELPVFDILVPTQSGLGKVNSEILKLFQAELVKSVPSVFTASALFKSKYAGQDFLFVKNVKSPDKFSACKLVKRNIVRLHDLLGLFYHKGSNEIGEEMLVCLQGDPSTTLALKSEQNLMQLISDNRKTFAARKLEGMIKSIRLPGGEDGEKFFRVVDFHGMSLNSAIPENQLINLWTSLETIAPSIRGRSIIGSVVEGVLPFIGLQYVMRTFVSIVRDLKRWDNKKFKAAIGAVSGGSGAVEKCFLLIVDPANDALCTSLLGDMDDFPLLKQRVFELNKRFATGKKAEAQIRLHCEKAGQQLHRIYRARNSIVHSAQKNRLTENLIVSAHEYFDQVFSLSGEMCSSPLRFDNYRDCFNYANLSYDSYLSDLALLGDSPATDASKFLWALR